MQYQSTLSILAHSLLLSIFLITSTSMVIDNPTPWDCSTEDFDSTIISTNNSIGLMDFSCSDGLRNGDETGVDCGGSNCSTCPDLSHGIIKGISSTWTTVHLDESYSSMIVVATPVITSNIEESIVTRIRNASGNSFEIKVQTPGTDIAPCPVDVYYIVAQEGVYNAADHGINMEAVKAPSTITAGKNNWVREERFIESNYTNPVVIGQVMTYNDPKWSVFWSSANSSQYNPPGASNLAAGKHVAEDPDVIRNEETIGFIVFDSASGQFGNTKYDVALGQDIVTGVGNIAGGITYSSSNITSESTIILSSAAMDGGDGGWPVINASETSIDDGSFNTSISEDQLSDTEVSHIDEQVAYIILRDIDRCTDGILNGDETSVDCGGDCGPCKILTHGIIEDISENWTTVQLAYNFPEMVVVATPVLEVATEAPVVTRIRKASGSSFQIKIQSTTGATNIGTRKVNYLVANEGVYTQATDGIKMEVKKVSSELTSNKINWVFEPRNYDQAYTNPVVLGQVMTYNDNRWSSFWASSNTSRFDIPSTNSFAAGKHCGEDIDLLRNSEDIGYIVIESGSDYFDEIEYSIGVTQDIVEGLENNSSGSSNEVPRLSKASTAVLSSAGMDGGDGGWPVLNSTAASEITNSAITISIDEDQISDAERFHTTEQVAYAVFGNIGPCYDESLSAGEEQIDCGGSCIPCATCDDGIKNGDEVGIDCGGSNCNLCSLFEYGIQEGVSDSWVTINLDKEYESMVVVASAILDNTDQAPVVTRIRNANHNSFQLRIQTPGATNLETYNVNYVVAEEGVYNQRNHGIKMEAVKITSSITSSKNNWNQESRSYQNHYNSPVILGQVMSYNDERWSTFWSSVEGDRLTPASSTSLGIGKHVAEDIETDRIKETLGYFVIETQHGEDNESQFTAFVGEDIIEGGQATQYDYSDVANAQVAIVSPAGMDGNDGGWPALYGTTPISSTDIAIIYDEDQIGDTERGHTTEQVSVLILGNNGSCMDGIQNQNEIDVDCGGVCPACQNAEIFAEQMSISYNEYEPNPNDPPVEVIQNDEFSVNYALYVQSQFTPPLTINTRFALSEDQTYSEDDIQLDIVTDTIEEVDGVETFFENTRNIRIPNNTPPGSYYFVLKFNHDELVNESNYNDNYLTSPINILAGTCDDRIINQDETNIDCGGLICAPCGTCPEFPDYEALMAFYNATGGPNWNRREGWGENCDVCSWEGVFCENDRVFWLYLLNNNITGDLPPELGDLSKLRRIEMQDNNISGTIPAEFENLTELDYVSLFSNQLTGEIPAFLGNIASLRFLILRQNQFNGEIPPSLSNLTQAQIINLSGNNLSGPIPPEFGSMFSLERLHLDDNNLSGCIPQELLQLCSAPPIGGGRILSLSNNPCLSHNSNIDLFCTGVSCTLPADTSCPQFCFDGILNGDEIGIDCGGSCPPCEEETVDLIADPSITILYRGLVYDSPDPLQPVEIIENDIFQINYSIFDDPLSNSLIQINSQVFLTLDDNLPPENIIELDVVTEFIEREPGEEEDYNITRQFHIPNNLLPGDYRLRVNINHEEIYFEPEYDNNYSGAQYIRVVEGTCNDGVQNQDETDIDCGPTCPTLCNAVDIVANFMEFYVEEEIVVPPFAIVSPNQEIGILYALELPEEFDPSLNFNNRAVLSQDNIYSEDDIEFDLFSTDIEDLLPADDEYWGIRELTLPINTPPGDYFYILKINHDETVIESNYDNNYLIHPVTIIGAETCSDGLQNGDETGIDCGGSCTPCIEICNNNQDDDNDGLIDCADDDCDGDAGCLPTYDLAITNVELTPDNIPIGGTSTIDVSITNIGDMDAIGDITLEYFVSSDDAYDEMDLSVGIDSFDLITQGSSIQFRSLITFPTSIPIGVMHIIALVNRNGISVEANQLNNELSFEFSILPPTCDDGTHNGDETGIDCGGACPDECLSCPFPQAEVDGLMAIYNALDGPNWINNDNWGIGCDICDWYGITCQGSTYSLILQNNNLTGELPDEIGQLRSLSDFNGSANNISGNIPPSIGNLQNLRGILLLFNNLSGILPRELGLIPTLSYLYLDDNDLSGCIPETFVNLCGKRVRLYGNPGLAPNDDDLYNFCSFGNDVCKNPIGERGNAIITDEWSTIPLDFTYNEAVIIAGPLSNNETNPAVITIRNIQSSSFEARIEEWDCTPDDHAEENFSFMAIESGVYEMDNGIKLAAIRSQIRSNSNDFFGIPAEFDPSSNILTQIISDNHAGAVTVQTELLTNENSDYFSLSLESAKTASDPHLQEEAGIILIENGIGNSAGDISPFESTKREMATTHVSSSINYQQSYTDPVIVGSISSVYEDEPAELRYNSIGNSSFNGFIDEDNSCGTDVNSHTAEDYSFVVFEGTGYIYGTEQLPDLTFTNVDVDLSNVTAGDIIPIDLTILNQGTITSSQFDVILYASTEDAITNTNVRLTRLARYQSGPLSAGGSITLSEDFFMPSDYSGDYFLIARVDPWDEIVESNEANNTEQLQFNAALHPCNNGIQDPGETGVDCGGTCDNACPVDLVWDTTCKDLYDETTFNQIEIDVNLEVGMTMGNATVTPNGASSYAIPIVIPSGTKGLQPQLSIVYNSQGRNGIMGQGWNMAGRSMISRTNKSIYFDGAPDPIYLNSSDALTIDGARLQVTNNQPYGSSNAEYCTEAENFSTVYPKEVGVFGAEWFEVKTKSGITVEYGRTPDSKFLASNGAVIYWNANKSYDSNGNYVEYKYNRIGNELLIDEIRYTLNDNAGTIPLNTIKFHYHERTDKNITYIVGQAMSSNHLLSKIEVSYDGQHIRSYEMCYANGPASGGIEPIRTYLQEVQEIGADNVTRLNATRFRYGDKTSSSPSVNPIVNGSDIATGNPEDYIRLADFNGDGIDDIALFRAEEKDDIVIAYSVEVYIKQGFDTNEFMYIGSQDLEEYQDVAGKKGSFLSFLGNFFAGSIVQYLVAFIPVVGWIQLVISLAVSFVYSPFIIAWLGADVNAGNFTFQAADLNGDNREEVILYTPDFDSKDGKELIFTIGVDVINNADVVVVNKKEFARNKDHKVDAFNLGDYDGDSMLDFFIVLNNGEDDDDKMTVGFQVGLSSRDYIFESTTLSNTVAPSFGQLSNAQYASGNFDGDAKTDIMITGASSFFGTKIATLRIEDGESPVLHRILDRSGPALNYPTRLHATRIGDFNGDGKADVLSVNQYGKWEIGFFDGQVFQRTGFSFDGVPTPTVKAIEESGQLTYTDYQQLFISDFNNDGKTDIFYMPLRDIDCLKDRGGPYKSFPDVAQYCIIDEIPNLYIYYSTGYSFVKEEIDNDFNDVFVRENNQVKHTIHQFDFGDFNGDGIPDLLSTATGYQLKYINPMTEDLLLKDILDGYNNKYSFDYAPMVDSEVYQQTNNPVINEFSGLLGTTAVSAPEFPINKVTFGSRIVKQFHSPNGLSNGLHNTLTYNYKDALYHRLGKGYLGFTNVEVKDKDQDRTSKSQNGLNLDFFTLFPTASQTLVSSSNQLLSGTAVEVTHQDRMNQRYWQRIDNTNNTDYITNRRRITSNIYQSGIEGVYGNLESVSTSISGGTTPIETTVTTFGDYTDKGSYIPYKPQSITLTRNRAEDGVDYTTTSTNSYNDQGTLIEKRDFVGLDQEVVTTFSNIDVFGNATEVTSSALNGDIESRTNNVVFDPTGRFVEKIYNAHRPNPGDQGQVSLVTFDYRWGLPVSVTTVDNNTTTIELDQFGRQEKVTLPAGYDVTHDFIWDVRGGSGETDNDASDAIYYTKTENPAAPMVQTWHNSVGRVRMSTTEDFTYGGNNSILTSIVQTYDVRGRLLKETSPFRVGDPLLYTSYDYDNINRLESAISPTGTSTYNYPLVSPSNGEYTITVTSEDGKSQSSTTDATGKLIESEDSGGGAMSYAYYSNGYPKSTSVNGVQVSSMLYDEHARQISLTELNSGTTNYAYNSFGEIIYQKDSRPNVIATEVAYDLLGRVDFIDQQEGHIEYTYVSAGDGLNQIEEVVNYNGLTESYTYDVLDRPISYTETINGKTFTHEYTYTPLDQLESMTYPSGLSISYEYYDDTGYLKSMLDHEGNNLYEPLTSNRYGQLTEYLLGNGLTTQIDYDQFGVLNQMQTQGSDVFNMSYDFDIQNGLLNSRTDHTQAIGGDLMETFTYDDHYRLLTAQSNKGANPLTMTYDDHGNILTKSDVSDDAYLYDADKIHAVTQINTSTPVPVQNQSVTYNSAHQPLTISDGDNNLNYIYGSDEQRRHAHMQENGVEIYQRYYCRNYEEQIINGVLQKIHYLDVGIIAVQEDNNPVEYFFTYGDYLGSILAVTDDTGTLIQRQSYDAWGRPRNAADWSQNNIEDNNLSWLYRGYTGHEMLPRLNTINMNGRLYDPQIGRMFSVDNYAGLDGTTQSYNRYSYVFNNPLMYTDPNGELPICPDFLASLMNFTPELVITATPTAGSAFLGAGISGLATSAGQALVGAYDHVEVAVIESAKQLGASGAGFVNAIFSNMHPTGEGRRDPSEFGEYSEFAANGQFAGDVTAALVGIIEQAGGAIAVGVGIVGAFETGGATLILSTEGAALASHGWMTTQNSIGNLKKYSYNAKARTYKESRGSRSSALRRAKRDANINVTQDPIDVVPVKLKNKGKTIIGDDGKPIWTREYHFKDRNGNDIIIQEHSVGHDQGGVGDQGPHFNVRPADNPHGPPLEGTEAHYYFDNPPK